MGSVTISGSEQKECNEPPPPPPATCTDYTYDSGTVSITVNGVEDSVPYSGNSLSSSTATSIASALATQINGDSSSYVTATASGAKITLVSKKGGANTDYSLSASSTSGLNLGSFAASPSGSTLTGGANGATQSDPSLSFPMPTVYTYDPLNDLTKVVQGSQARSFVYDSMGHLTSSTTPEAGAVSFTYTSFGQVSTRTDARSVETLYQYDGLNRPIGVSYVIPSGSSVSAMPNVCTTAGGTSANVCLTYGTSAAAYNNGRQLQMTDPTGSEAYTYDALGRVTAMTKTIGGVSYPLGYTYDFASDLTSITYPSGRVVQQTTDTLGRLQQITSSGVNYVSNLAYNAASQPTGFTYGNGVQAAFAYNSRMQLQSLDYTFNSQTLFGLNYYYKVDSTNCPSGNTGNNGQIQCIDDVVDAGRTAKYTYDAWNRLLTASTAGSTNYPAWGLSWSYDRYGNRLSQAVTAGTAPSNTVTASVTTNRLASPYTYDASGNMTYDGLNTPTFDGQGRVTANLQGGSSSTYNYDGHGVRVQKQTTGPATVYVFSGAKVIAEYPAGGTPTSPSTEYIYARGRLVATLAGGTTTYLHPDHLSVRISTNTSGAIAGQQAHYPFGEAWYAQNSTSKWQFTSYERDSESANDYAMARIYINRLGRFASVDPLSGSVGNPQSLNRYSYVLNNPIGLVDPFGMGYCAWDDGTADDTPEDGGFDKATCTNDENGGTWVYSDPDLGTLSYNTDMGQLPIGPNDVTILPSPGGTNDSPQTDPSYDPQIGMDFIHCPGCPDIWNSTAGSVDFFTNVEVGVWTAGAALPAALSVSASAIGTSYAVFGAGGGFALGLYPDYLDAADELGVGAFNIPNGLYNFLQSQGVAWTANQAYILAQVTMGRSAYLAGVPTSWSTYSMELDYLSNSA
jgi:RHS repeat-associated protein